MAIQTKKPNSWRATSARSTRRSLGVSANDAAEMVERVRKGFAYNAIVNFHKASGLPVGRIADWLQIPPRTLMRRKAKGRLLPEESDKLLRISRVFDKAIDLFEGDTDSARRWLITPNKELDDQAPIDFSRTEVGAREVEDLIGRLEHGVFS